MPGQTRLPVVRQSLIWVSRSDPKYWDINCGIALMDIRALPLLSNSTASKARGRCQGLGKLVQPVIPSRVHPLCNPW